MCSTGEPRHRSTASPDTAMEGRRIWFPMATRRRSSQADDTVVKQGCLIKSPPPNVFFTKRKSWKGRLIKVCRTPMGCYYIRYYSYNGATEELKGEIAMSDIQSIELGSDADERIQIIVQLFSSSPGHVLCIKTSRRDYYLVDDNEKNIDDWRRCLMDIWVESNRASMAEGPLIAHLSQPSATPQLSAAPQLSDAPQRTPVEVPHTALPPLTSAAPQLSPQEEAVRPKSYPENHPHTDSAQSQAHERQRSLTDPEKQQAALSTSRNHRPSLFGEISEIWEPPEDAPEKVRGLRSGDTRPAGSHLMKEIRRLSLDASNKNNPESRRDSEDSTDAAYNSDPEQEHIYDIPKSTPVSKHPSLEYTEEEEDSSDSPDDNVYEKMKPQSSFDLEMSPPPADLSPSSIPEKAQSCWCPPKPIRTSKLFAEPNSEQTDLSDSVKIFLTVPKVHLQKYLGLQEVGERLCVSKWKGPPDIGCLFHFGDHILAINKVGPVNKDFFLQILSRSIYAEVNLEVIRNRKAGVFHVEGCRCGES